MKYTTRWILINLTAIFFQEFSVQVTFREQWNDERLRYVDSTRGSCPVFWRKFSSTLFVQYGEIYWNRVRSCLCLPMTFINWLIHCSLVSLRLDWCDSINQSINHIMQDYFSIFYCLFNTGWQIIETTQQKTPRGWWPKISPSLL